MNTLILRDWRQKLLEIADKKRTGETRRGAAQLATALSIFLLPTWALSDDIGEFQNGQSLFSAFSIKTFSGKDAQIFQDGSIRFARLIAATNDFENVTVQQRGFVDVSEDFQAFVEGKNIRCIIVLEINQTLYADCSIFLDGWLGEAYPLLELAREGDPSAIGCSASQREHFSNAGKAECIELEKNE